MRLKDLQANGWLRFFILCELCLWESPLELQWGWLQWLQIQSLPFLTLHRSKLEIRLFIKTIIWSKQLPCTIIQLGKIQTVINLHNTVDICLSKLMSSDDIVTYLIQSIWFLVLNLSVKTNVVLIKPWRWFSLNKFLVASMIVSSSLHVWFSKISSWLLDNCNESTPTSRNHWFLWRFYSIYWWACHFTIVII